MVKQFFSLCAGLVATAALMAQAKGILPLNGIRYSNEGIWSKNIAVKINGQQLLGNRVPMGKEITVSVAQPSGFTENAKLIYAGAELTLLSPKGEVLFRNPNFFVKNEATGFDTRTVKQLEMKFVIAPEMLRGNNTCTMGVRLYDIKGKSQLKLDFPVSIVTRPTEALQLVKAAAALKSNDPASLGAISGVTSSGVKVSLDTTLYVAPKMAYISLDITDIKGSSLTGIMGGTKKFWVYDANMNEIRMKDILLENAKGSLESTTVDYTLKIPYRLKTAPDKGYTVRFRWEGEQQQVIDVVVTR